MYESFIKMPTILKFLTAHALVCIVFFLAAAIPGIPISVDGQVMSFSEIWSSGLGIYISFIGITMPVCGWLMLKRTAYARLIYLVILSFGLIAPAIYLKETVSIVFGIVITILIAIYLYGRASVRLYFT